MKVGDKHSFVSFCLGLLCLELCESSREDFDIQSFYLISFWKKYHEKFRWKETRRDSYAIKGIILGVVIISLNLKKVSLLQN